MDGCLASHYQRGFLQHLMVPDAETQSRTLDGAQGNPWKRGRKKSRSQRDQGHHETTELIKQGSQEFTDTVTTNTHTAWVCARPSAHMLLLSSLVFVCVFFETSNRCFFFFFLRLLTMGVGES